MRLRERLRRRWQILTGEEDTPFDGDVPAWLFSLLFHLCLLGLLMVFLHELQEEDSPVELISTIIEPDREEEAPQEFFFSELEKPDIGANGLDSFDMADAAAEIELDITELTTEQLPLDPTEAPVNEISFESIVDVSMAVQNDPNIVIQGAAGVGATGTVGAIDRITQEIIDSLEERKTLVVWIFDKSKSLSVQREAMGRRMGRIYEELNYIETMGDSRFLHHHDKPLLSSVMTFAKSISIQQQPTDRVDQLRQSVSTIENDATGVERVFQAVYTAAEQHKKYTLGPDRRNVMFVLFTDEAGDDSVEMLDRAVALCQKHRMRVFVVGIPAPFGRREVEVKWIDPDPQFDQRPQWPRVTHGPESLHPERLKLAFPGKRQWEEPLDSGFGPFALTRLAVETSGIYFCVHPQRDLDRPVRKREISHLSAYIKYFFDPDVMRRYRPDYVSVGDYMRLLNKNSAKMALVRAATFSHTRPLEKPRLRFPRQSEPALVSLLSKAQEQSAKILAGTLVQMVNELQRGEADRDKIRRPRWQAGYDLAMGRALAAKVRTQGYNLMLARLRQGMKFQDPKNDTWVIRPSEKILSGSMMEKEAKKAENYLQRVRDDHPDTPWALIAQQELAIPLGWEWDETFTNVNPPPKPPTPGGNPPQSRRDDRIRTIQKPKERRAPPKI
jgi:hypothetical protein